MPQNQWKMEGDYKPWYIGWNVCEKTKNEILRQFYEIPFFIPEGSIHLESNSNHKYWKGLWIFMGSTGLAATFHIDNMEHPSWQAQVKDIQWCAIENHQDPICVVNLHFSRRPDRY